MARRKRKKVEVQATKTVTTTSKTWIMKSEQENLNLNIIITRGEFDRMSEEKKDILVKRFIEKGKQHLFDRG